MTPLRINIPKGSSCEGLVSPTHTSPNLLKNLQLAFTNKQELKIASLGNHIQLYTEETITKKETKVRFGVRTIYYF